MSAPEFFGNRESPPLALYEKDFSGGRQGLRKRDNNQGNSRNGESPFPLISARDLVLLPMSPDWLIDGVIAAGTINLEFGEPASGKSLLALEMGFCCASGIDWNLRATKKTDVVVIVGEGYAGLSRRIRALENKYDIPAPENLFISEQPAQLIDSQNAARVIESIKERCQNPGLVIIDTLHRNIDGDENSSQDIGRFIANLDNYFKPFGVAVLIVHHSGHGQKDRSRGSSAIRASMDAEFSVVKCDDSVILSCTKAKDFEPFRPMQFSIKTISLDHQDCTEPLTGVYLEPACNAIVSAKKQRLSARDDAILTALKDAIAEKGIEPTTEIKRKYGGFNSLSDKDKKIVHIDSWRDKAYKRLDVESPEAARKAFKRCREKLFEMGRVMDYSGYWWPIYD